MERRTRSPRRLESIDSRHRCWALPHPRRRVRSHVTDHGDQIAMAARLGRGGRKKPLSALWKVTRSTRPARTSGRRRCDRVLPHMIARVCRAVAHRRPAEAINQRGCDASEPNRTAAIRQTQRDALLANVQACVLNVAVPPLRSAVQGTPSICAMVARHLALSVAWCRFWVLAVVRCQSRAHRCSMSLN
jgi:hypothetical protein